MTRLDEIEARLQAATPGPWEADTKTRGDCVVWGPNGAFVANSQAAPHWTPAPDGGVRAVAFDMDRRDVELIANAPADLAALVAVVREVEALAGDLTGIVSTRELRAVLRVLEES